MIRSLVAAFIASLPLVVAAGCAAPSAGDSAADPTREVIAAAVSEVRMSLEGRVVLDTAGLDPGTIDAGLAQALDVELGRRQDRLRCTPACELVDADALISIADHSLTGDGDGARVLLLLWTAGQRATSETALTVTLRREMVEGAQTWRVVEVAPRYVS